uniref:Hcy-binding domain-containing protein n=1 Tax=Caenorhabditis japonica TaxID=281687 RepID=A0A8R1DVY9_CAEJA
MPSKIRLLDGSMSAQLSAFGYNTEDHKPHWTFPANEDLELMKQVYQSNLSTGADVVTTNTYHFGSVLDTSIAENVQKRVEFERFFEKTCNLMVKLVKEAGSNTEVWGSVGTLATMYHDLSEYNGKYIDLPGSFGYLKRRRLRFHVASRLKTQYMYISSQDTALNYFKTVIAIFQEKTVIRKLVFETIPTEREAMAAVSALQQFPEMKAVISFTCDKNGCLRHGEKITNVAKELENNKQIVGIGVNCTDPSNITAALLEIRHCNFQEIFVYPNVGDATFLDNEKDEEDVFKFDLIASWVDSGATVIGGCCGVQNKQLLSLRKIIDKINKH